MRHFIVNHTKLYGEPGRTTNTTVAEWKAAVKKSFGLNYYNDMLLEISEQYATFYWVYELQEQYMYGSSRLGSVQRNLPLVQQVLNSDSLIYYSYANDSIRYMERGQKKRRLSANRRKLSNHLGNVLAVVTDRKLVHCSNDELMWFDAQVVSVTDYYPFGSKMESRSWAASGLDYKFAFNGKEQDSEVSGSGNSYDYGFRIYNPRLGKFLSVDPLSSSFPWYTPYQFAGNRPIEMLDLDGLELLNYRSSYQITYSRDGITDNYAAHYQGNGRSEIPNLANDPDEKVVIHNEINETYDRNIHPNVDLPEPKNPTIKKGLGPGGPTSKGAGQAQKLSDTPGANGAPGAANAIAHGITLVAKITGNYLESGSFDDWKAGRMKSDQIWAAEKAIKMTREQFGALPQQYQNSFSIDLQMDVANYIMDGTVPSFFVIEHPGSDASPEAIQIWEANISAENNYVETVINLGEGLIEQIHINKRQRSEPSKLDYHIENTTD